MSTRDPVETLRERTAQLEEELRNLDQRRRERTALETEVKRVETELGKSRTLLDRLSSKRALPMLDAMSIASPCSADWAQMVGDDKVRYCGKCEKNVFNLSAMTREEAEITVLAKEGDLCVRLYQRHDGTVLTQDCPVGVRRKRLRLVGALAIGSSLAGAAAALVAGGIDAEPPPPTAVVDAPIEYVPMTPETAQPVEPPPTPSSNDGDRGRWVAGGLRPAPSPPPPPPPPHKVGPTHGKQEPVRHLMGKPSMPMNPKNGKDLL